ncbi:hypothetical protein [Micromonospora sp. CPCC 205561]|uniref:hypothetical protein n=1 Tax=Micromonospora sp. CPCC 205561 TaxID=3122407 RepID=UPI002FF1DC8D
MSIFKQARENDGFRRALRSMATRRKIDFSFNGSLSWPESEWYTPETFGQVAAQDAIKRARKQGLPDRIEDRPTLDKIAALGKR